MENNEPSKEEKALLNTTVRENHKEIIERHTEHISPDIKYESRTEAVVKLHVPVIQTNQKTKEPHCADVKTLTYIYFLTNSEKWVCTRNHNE